MRASPYLLVIGVMWPQLAYGSTKDGAIVAVMAVTVLAFVLGIIASTRFTTPWAKFRVLVGGFVVVWIGLLVSAGSGGSAVEKMIDMALFMIVIMPIPFFMAFILGVLNGYFVHREQRKGKGRWWPFSASPHEVAVTVRSISERGDPVLLVSRISLNGGWQFLTGEPFAEADRASITLQSIVSRDPTLAELADLPVGWEASRPHVGHQWSRVQSKEQ